MLGWLELELAMSKTRCAEAGLLVLLLPHEAAVELTPLSETPTSVLVHACRRYTIVRCGSIWIFEFVP